jgi:hypothetical protein
LRLQVYLESAIQIMVKNLFQVQSIIEYSDSFQVHALAENPNAHPVMLD